MAARVGWPAFRDDGAAAGSAQPAPVPRAIVRRKRRQEAMSALFNQLVGDEQTIAIPGAAWLQLQLSEVQLGQTVLTITLRVGRLAELFAGGD